MNSEWTKIKEYLRNKNQSLNQQFRAENELGGGVAAIGGVRSRGSVSGQRR